MQLAEHTATKRVEITVRAYARRHKGQWLAHCLDLDLMVVRPTLPEAQRELDKQIVLHLQTALELGGDLRRPAPLRYWLLFYAGYSAHVIRDVGRKLFHGVGSARWIDGWLERRRVAIPIAA